MTVVRDEVCEGEVDSEGVPREEVFSVLVRSEEGSSVEVRGPSRVATISIQEAAECSKFSNFHETLKQLSDTEECV